MATQISNAREFQDAGVLVTVKVGIGPDNDRRWREFPIDAETGIIQIPAVHLYGDVDITASKVRAFDIDVSHVSGDDPWVVISGRDADNNYKRLAPGFSFGELQTYHFPPCSVALTNRNAKLRKAERGCGEKAVFTTPKSQSGKRGINRVDAWVLKKNGFIGLFQVLVTTFDDGKTFRLVGEWRGRWNIHRLPNPRPYKPQYSPVASRRHQQEAVFAQPTVQKMLDQIIFVPEGSYTGFDSRIELLQNDKVLYYIEDNLAEFAVWTESVEGDPIRNFSIRPDVEGIKLVGNRGVLQFFSHSLGACGYGIVVGADDEERQVRYHSFVNAHTDAQGMLQILDGDVVEWDEEVEMGVDNKKHPYPNLLAGVHVQLVNVAKRRAMPIVDSASAAVAA